MSTTSHRCSMRSSAVGSATIRPVLAKHTKHQRVRSGKLFLWDCRILTADGKRAAFFSHDEYGIVCDLEGVPDSVRDSLDKLRFCRMQKRIEGPELRYLDWHPPTPGERR